MARIVLAMSGGVDSSVAAWLLREAGHDLIGVFMRHGAATSTACASPAGVGLVTGVGLAAAGTGAPLPVIPLPAIKAAPLGHKQGCCTASDAEDARRVAAELAIPFYSVDFQEEFSQIIDYFVAEYTAARTPNPCVVCNNWLKFGRLFDYADSVGAEFVATGHYAQIVETSDGPGLARGVDQHKDQAYVLFGIARRLLARIQLPVGGYHKPEIRQIAERLGFRVADKRDSQEICFVPDGDHAAFVRARSGVAVGSAAAGGEIVTTAGQVVGHHEGLERFTIGQRKGLGIAFGEPRFVVRLEPETRQVVVGDRADLTRHSLTARGVNWLAPTPSGPIRCQAKIRYNSQPAAATFEPLADGRLRVNFDEPQYGVAPGQAVVGFIDDRVLGGGWIE